MESKLFDIFKSKPKKKGTTFVPPQNDDGAIDVDVGPYDYAAQVVSSFDLDRIPTNEYELTHIYRTMALQQEVDEGIQEIINEAIISDELRPSVSIALNNVDLSDNIKEKISDEFELVLKLLNFKNKGYNLFNRWYVDGKLIFHKVIDGTKVSEGITTIVPIDPLHVKLIREIKIKRDSKSGELDLYDLDDMNEYFIYSKQPLNSKDNAQSVNKNGIKISKDAITYCTSGVMDESGKIVLSNLYKAIKPWNNLKLMEDSLVIYRVTRAPERRAFYVDVGNLPKGKAEQYLKDIMNRFKNKIVYDASTGTVTNQKKYHAMIEDYWLPRREGGRGTEVTTLQGGQQLGEIDDTKYFKDKLYRALNVPLSRFQQESSGFSLGRTTEITRDEVKFSKFISRMRKRFSFIFDDILKTQLVLKKIITEDEWADIVDDIGYSFLEDNFFAEMKEVEITRERMETLQQMQTNQVVGTYYSHDYIRQNILKQTEEEIKEEDEKMAKERKEMEPEEIPDPDNRLADVAAAEEEEVIAAAAPAAVGEPKPKPKPKPDNEKDDEK